MTSAHTTETPVSGDIDNGAAITVGNKVMVDEVGTVSAIRFWVPSTNSGTYTVGLYEVTADDDPLGSGTGTELATASVGSGSVTPDDWAQVAITPQAVTTGVVYLAAVHASSGRFVQTAGALGSAGISNGGVNILQSGSDPNPPGLGTQRNGTFNEGAALAYPASAFGTPDYFVDVAYSVAGEATTGALAATLPPITAAAAAAATSDATIAATLPALAGTLAAAAASAAAAAAVLPSLAVDLTGSAQCDGSLTATLPALSAALTDAISGGSGPRATSSAPVGRITHSSPVGRLL